MAANKLGNNSTFKNGIKVTSSNSGSGVFIDSTDHVTIINSTFIQNVVINCSINNKCLIISYRIIIRFIFIFNCYMFFF